TSFKLPSNNIEDLNLGKIKYSASYNGISETFYSGKITCKKSDIIVSSDPAATPKGGNYINVGSGYVAEITAPFAETFNGNTTDDWSRPTNNYLPKGTVDYCSTGLVYDALSDMNFVTLRCGRRVYLEKQDPPDKTKTAVVKRYIATLPDHNEITVSGLTSSGRHTVLTLNTLFKAPFYFDLHNQNYTNPATQNYTVSALTFSYVDITFCYATVFGGEVELPPDNPVFSSAQIIRGPYDTTLRLFLKVPGKFYGWDAYYNSNGQLCFEFLNPVQINDADNAYGTSLSGAKIFIDAGHGGIDCGALAYNRAYTEANRNLNLALKVKQRLEALGAEVIISRSGDTTLTAQNRMLMLKNAKPDLCVSIHHDSNNKSQLNGFSAYHFNAFSKTAAQYVYNRTYNTGIYSSYQLKWHYFFLARVTTCPVVLTENGYMSSPADFGNIQNDSANNAKADAITSGIVDYFRSIKQ
ncbi:MAG: N-acetylmuramoyl-L-alanine amidase, partial [Clostridia bacterium]|nr:N-acetylmuramoyl-L-alanine amidase [Clostridia bacterium]